MATQVRMIFNLTLVGERQTTENLRGLIQNEMKRLAKLPGVVYSDVQTSYDPFALCTNCPHSTQEAFLEFHSF